MALNPVRAHGWDLTPKEAIALQAELAAQGDCTDRFGDLSLVAGIDVGFEQGGRVTRAAIVVLRLADLVVVEHAVARRPTSFPYVPGLLSFREIPAAVDALARLASAPELLVCDGQGLAHPRRFGLACHLGWLMDLPCIGVAKSRLIGSFEEPGPERGAVAPLLDAGERIGTVVRSRARVKPVFVSPGYRVGQASAVRLALACTGRFRLPEPTRQAHRLASPPPKARRAANRARPLGSA